MDSTTTPKKRARRSKAAETRHSVVSTSTSAKLLDDLQPELIEMVFANLCDDNGNKSLLACRGVSKRWKSIVDGMLERASQRTYLTVHPAHQIPKEFRYPVIPRIGVDQRFHTCCDLGKGLCPYHVVSQGRRLPSSPFPSKSLCIDGSPGTHLSPPLSQIVHQKYSPGNFVSNYGHHLVFLTLRSKLCPYCNLRSLNVREMDMVYILQRTPNLKGLILEGTRVIPNRKPDGKKQKQSMPELPNLTSLKIRRTVTTTPNTEVYWLSITEWLFKAYSKQLICLEVDHDLEDALTPENFPKLKELKISTLNLPAVMDPVVVPLRRLIITELPNKLNHSSFMQFVSFVEMFASTLEHLEVPSIDLGEKTNLNLVELDSEKVLRGRGSKIIFQKLKVFGVQYSTDTQDMSLMKQLFLRKFPNLQTIELLDSDGRVWLDSSLIERNEKKQIIRFLVRQCFWEVCKWLEKVRAFPDSGWGRAFVLSAAELKRS